MVLVLSFRGWRYDDAGEASVYGVGNLYLCRCHSRVPGSGLSENGEVADPFDFASRGSARDLSRIGGSCAAAEIASVCVDVRAFGCGIPPLLPSSGASPATLASSLVPNQCDASSRQTVNGGGVVVPRQDSRCSCVPPEFLFLE